MDLENTEERIRLLKEADEDFRMSLWNHSMTRTPFEKIKVVKEKEDAQWKQSHVQ